MPRKEKIRFGAVSGPCPSRLSGSLARRSVTGVRVGVEVGIKRVEVRPYRELRGR